MVGIRDAATLAGVLEAASGTAPRVTEPDIDGLWVQLEEAARTLHQGDYPLDAGPVRINKGLVDALVTCEQRALLRARSDPPLSENLVLGTLIDLLALHRAVTGRLSDKPLGLAEELLRLEAQDDDRAAEQLDWLRRLDRDSRNRLGATLTERYSTLLMDWPDLESWHPRPREAANLILADGDVVVAGLVDIALGGSRWGRPGVLIEVKGGTQHSRHQNDQRLYALLFALRDVEAPVAVATCSAADGAVVAEPVDAALLATATRRLAAALETACRLAGGAEPRACDQPSCPACTDQTVASETNR